MLCLYEYYMRKYAGDNVNRRLKDQLLVIPLFYGGHSFHTNSFYSVTHPIPLGFSSSVRG